MKFLHIVSNWNYNIMIPYIQFINEQLSQSDHVFLVIDQRNNVPTGIVNQSNTLVLDPDSKEYFRSFSDYLNEAENVLIHGQSLKTYQLIWLLINPNVLKKITWIAWGVDLYQIEKPIIGSLKNKIKNKLINIVSLRFREKVPYFVGIFPPDVDYFKAKFKSVAKTFYASYTVNVNNPFYKRQLALKTLGDKVKNNEVINIQIGHSSSEILNHLEVLEELFKYKDENIKIFIPLSYGDMKYGDKVERRAKELFGEKVVTIREIMTNERYMTFLSNIDIVIFNTPRQIGLGNLSPLLFMEKKIFIPRGTVMYDFYHSENINIQDYNAIKYMSFNDFTSTLELNSGKKYVIENELDLQKKIKMWTDVFNGIQREG